MCVYTWAYACLWIPREDPFFRSNPINKLIFDFSLIVAELTYTTENTHTHATHMYSNFSKIITTDLVRARVLKIVRSPLVRFYNFAFRFLERT